VIIYRLNGYCASVIMQFCHKSVLDSLARGTPLLPMHSR
jgi:hypothetical protein